MLKRWGQVIFAMLLVCFLLTTCTCAHKWKEATCTEPKTCVYCGMTEGEPLGHDWKAATINYPKTCVRCGKTEAEAYGIYYKNRCRVSTASVFFVGFNLSLHIGVALCDGFP